MNSLEQKVQDYVKEKNMHVSSLDPESVINSMLEEMEKGLTDGGGSYDMIPTYVRKNENINYEKEVIVLDAGGTNFRVCTVKIDEDRQVHISNYSTYPMPGMKEEVSKDEFFEIIYSYIQPVVDKSDSIGFCFSYPGEIDENLDCTLLFFAKEIKAPEVIGQKIGENINLVLEKHGHKRKQITILNDTIATLLAGMLNPEHHVFENYIGFILGTGLNAGYMEENRNIRKISGLDPEQSQAINMEGGRFSRLPHSEVDKKFFDTTISPDEFNFEKVVSGAYLGGLCTTLFQEAAADGLFSEEDADKIGKLDLFPTPEISHILETKTLPESKKDVELSAEALEILRLLAENLVDRVGLLAALLLTATAVKEGGGKSKDKPICLSINGSTVEKMHGLRARLDYWLEKVMTEQYGIYFEIIVIDNAPIIGTSIAALTR